MNPTDLPAVAAALSDAIDVADSSSFGLALVTLDVRLPTQMGPRVGERVLVVAAFDHDDDTHESPSYYRVAIEPIDPRTLPSPQ